MRCLIALALIAYAAPALADPHHHPPQDAAIHERFYSTWMRPDYPNLSCCNLEDCYPTQMKQVGAEWYALRREDSQWVLIPASKIEQHRDNPDGRNHVCMSKPYPDGTSSVYCAILGGGA